MISGTLQLTHGDPVRARSHRRATIKRSSCAESPPRSAARLRRGAEVVQAETGGQSVAARRERGRALLARATEAEHDFLPALTGELRRALDASWPRRSLPRTGLAGPRAAAPCDRKLGACGNAGLKCETALSAVRLTCVRPSPDAVEGPLAESGRCHRTRVGCPRWSTPRRGRIRSPPMMSRGLYGT